MLKQTNFLLKTNRTIDSDMLEKMKRELKPKIRMAGIQDVKIEHTKTGTIKISGVEDPAVLARFRQYVAGKSTEDGSVFSGMAVKKAKYSGISEQPVEQPTLVDKEKISPVEGVSKDKLAGVAMPESFSPDDKAGSSSVMASRDYSFSSSPIGKTHSIDDLIAKSHAKLGQMQQPVNLVSSGLEQEPAAPTMPSESVQDAPPTEVAGDDSSSLPG